MFFFSEPKFVRDYTPPLIYQRTKKRLAYTISILDETCINDHEVKNSYSQDLMIDLLHKEGSGHYYFDCQTLHKKFKLAKTLTRQGKLLEDLATITEQLRLTVTKDGDITSVNHRDISKKWEVLKKTLLKAHRGNNAHAFIMGVDKKIQRESLFLEELKQVKLFGLLFNGYQTLSKHSSPTLRKISNVIKSLPMVFEEKVLTVNEEPEKQERHIAISGRMEELPKETQNKINTYFKYVGIGSDPVFLSNYHLGAVLNLETGYLRSAAFDMELVNGRGYVRKKSVHLRLKK